MNKTQADRLCRLADFLRTNVPPNKFDLSVVLSSVAEDNREIIEQLKDPASSTAACALGWCAVVFPDHFSFVGGYLHYRGVSTRYVLHKVAEDFFGIDRDESLPLFSLDRWIKRTPKQEAKEIEKVVSNHGYTYAD